MKMIKTRIENVADIVNGATPSTANNENYGGDIVWLTPNDLSEQRRKYTYRGERNITLKGLNSCSAKLVPEGTVLLTSRAPIGLLSIAKKELCTNQGFKNLVPKDGVLDSEYLYYYLKLQVENLNRIGAKTTFKEITKDDVADFPIQIPEALTGQQRIASVLSALDEKIELNNRINTELEQMAKTLYDYWFMQYDFPDKNGKPYKSSGGAMAFSRDLKREIPKDWTAAPIQKLLATSKNGDWGEDEPGADLIQVYCVRGADIDALNGRESKLEPPMRFIRKGHEGRLLKPDDLIVEISGGSPTQSTGRIAHIGEKVFNRFKTPIVCSNFCKAISFKDRSYSYVVKQFWNKLYEAGIFFNFEGKTSGIKNLMFNRLIQDVHIAIPSDEKLIEEFYLFSAKNDELIQNNLLQNQQLAELRDWLLPMLMNGQVSVLDQSKELGTPKSKAAETVKSL